MDLTGRHAYVNNCVAQSSTVEDASFSFARSADMEKSGGSTPLEGVLDESRVPKSPVLAVCGCPYS